MVLVQMAFWVKNWGRWIIAIIVFLIGWWHQWRALCFRVIRRVQSSISWSWLKSGRWIWCRGPWCFCWSWRGRFGLNSQSRTLHTRLSSRSISWCRNIRRLPTLTTIWVLVFIGWVFRVMRIRIWKRNRPLVCVIFQWINKARYWIKI